MPLKPEELKNKFKKLAKSDNYIDGIFNYCDRWCERCYMTSKCRSYAMETENPVSKDPTNEEFWNHLQNVFEATRLLVEEGMKEMGIELSDLSDIEPEEELNPHEHSLYRKAHDLAMLVTDWLDQKQEVLKNKAEIALSISDEKGNLFVDAIEVIRWYNFFIAAKIFRALPHTESDKVEEASIYDSNGSAKIALISVDRSIAAWGLLLEHIPEEEDSILNFLRELSGIKLLTEKEFPDARKFVRPGFDDN